MGVNKKSNRKNDSCYFQITKYKIMYKRLIITAFLPFLSFIFLANIYTSSIDDIWTPETKVAEVLTFLGQSPPKHTLTSPATKEMIEQGKALVTLGFTENKKGHITSRQSKHFVCTSCHNIQQEDPNLRFNNPDDRLSFAIDNNLPFLQGSTLHGVVDRTSWYNGDYYKKYGKLVVPAREDLTEAIQLCAVECSQGRALTSEEMQAVLAYFWSLSLELRDLGLKEADWERLKAAQKGEEDKTATATWLQTFYSQASPATFTDAYESQQASNKLEGNPKRGEAIYTLSCLHCHRADKGITAFTLDLSKLTFNMLERHLDKYNSYSLHQITRFGTKPMMGYKPYMPLYTLERMSNQQLADLKSFIQSKTN